MPSYSRSTTRSRRSQPAPSLAKSNAEPTACLCGRLWDYDQQMVECGRCKMWHHLKCVRIPDFGPHMLASMDYAYECAQCSPKNECFFERQKPTFKHIVLTALWNLQKEVQKDAPDREFVSISNELIPFIEKHAEQLMHKRTESEREGWQTKCKRVLGQDHQCWERRGDDEVRFVNWREPWLMASDPPPSAKRQASDTAKPAKRAKAPIQDPAVVAVPYTKEGWRYEYAQPASGSSEHSTSYRIVRWQSPPQIASGDRAEQLKLARDNLTMTGHKGYAMARATQGVFCGRWYYEVEIKCDDMGVSGLSETRQPHWRIGWAQRHGAVQAPCGFDRFSYSWRDIDGQKFHNSRGAPFSKEGYGPGDVLGFEIVLPQRVTSRVLPIQTRGTHVSVVAQGNTFIAEKQKLSTPELFEAVPGSKIICYKNGVCQGVMFEDINCGTYYPAISLYNHAQVVANFGPTFKFPPPNKECRPISAAAAYTHAALSLAESIARVVNTRDVPAQKKEVREKLLDSGKVDTASACASSGSGSASSGSTATTSTATAATAAGDLGEGEALDDMKPPPYHPRMALSARKKFRAFLLRQRVFIDQETFETLPSRLQPRTTPDTHYI